MSEPFYQEFKSVLEMIYVVEKAHYSHLTAEQKQYFEQNFVRNLLRMQQNKRFQKDYALYEEATAQGKIIRPTQDAHQEKLNALLKEMVAIDLACQPYRLENKEIWRKQADTRLKYEKRLKNNEFYIKVLTKKKKEK